MLKKSSLLFSCAFIAGIGVDWRLEDQPAQVPRQTPAKITPRATPPIPAWTTDDFLKIAREQARVAGQPDYNPLAVKLSDWTDGEIVAALDASLTDPDVVLLAGSAYGLDGNLLGEWMRRDFEAALSWFDQLGSRTAKSRLAVSLSNFWPGDGTAGGFAYFLKNRELFPPDFQYSLPARAFDRAMEESPAATGKFLETLREAGFQFPTKAQALLQGNPRDLMPVLEGIGNPSLRISLLENARPAKVDGQVLSAPGIDQAQEDQLREKLASWNATPDQIESIVSRFHP